jgi:hypothetical protein
MLCNQRKASAFAIHIIIMIMIITTTTIIIIIIIIIPGNHKVRELQKTAILGTAHILRKVLT